MWLAFLAVLCSMFVPAFATQYFSWHSLLSRIISNSSLYHSYLVHIKLPKKHSEYCNFYQMWQLLWKVICHLLFLHWVSFMQPTHSCDTTIMHFSTSLTTFECCRSKEPNPWSCSGNSCFSTYTHARRALFPQNVFIDNFVLQRSEQQTKKLCEIMPISSKVEFKWKYHGKYTRPLIISVLAAVTI